MVICFLKLICIKKILGYFLRYWTLISRCGWKSAVRVTFLPTSTFFHKAIWLYSLIQVGNKPIYYKTWFFQSILKVSDLMENGTRFLSFTKFKCCYNIKPSFQSQAFKFYGIISTIKLLCKTAQEHFFHDSGAFLQNFLKANKRKIFIYKTLVERKRTNLWVNIL